MCFGWDPQRRISTAPTKTSLESSIKKISPHFIHRPRLNKKSLIDKDQPYEKRWLRAAAMLPTEETLAVMKEVVGENPEVVIGQDMFCGYGNPFAVYTSRIHRVHLPRCPDAPMPRCPSL